MSVISGRNPQSLSSHHFTCYKIRRTLAVVVVAFIAAAPLVGFQATSLGAAAYTWTGQKSGTTEDLLSLCAFDSTHVWAVGNAGTIRFFNGVKWADQNSGTLNDIYGVSALDANRVWAVGNPGTVRYFNGKSWAGQNSGTAAKLYCVSALDARHVWASGSNGTIRFFNGSGWAGQTSGTTEHMNSVSAADARHVWCVGPFGTIRFFNGSSWDGQTSGTPEFLIGVFALDANHVWAVGNNGTILFYDGHSWAKQTSGTTSQLWEVFALDSRHVWAVGVNGTIRFYNGSSWAGQESGTDELLQSVTCAGTGRAWAAGDSGTIRYGRPPAPVLSSITPSYGGAGTEVTLTGRNFFPARGFSFVSFGSVKATEYTSWSDRKIKVKVRELLSTRLGFGKQGSGGVQVTVATAGGASAGLAFSPTTPVWYLAEGSNSWGFQTYITIENPNASAVHAKITYQTTNGPVSGGTIPLAPQSQTTVSPTLEVMSADFSTLVECTEGKTIAVDRTMTWKGPTSEVFECHSSIGVTAPSRTWYLAEGSTNWGFECWLLIQNPNSTEATCDVTYMIEGESPVTKTKKIPANSRKSFDMSKDIGAKDASIKVDANVPVIPERAMYRNNRREGHDSIGTTSPALDYYLAEGTTAYGFTTYVLIQNPNDKESEVTVTYMTPSGPRPQPSFTMPANSRKTIKVNGIAEVSSTDLSTHVNGSLPIIAERAMYWDSWAGETCHDSIGMASAHSVFYLPDGFVSDIMETFTLVQNPNSHDVEVEISYFRPKGKNNVVFTDIIPANSRRTYNMGDKNISGGAAIMVTCKTPGKKIMCERAMYWNRRTAGTDTIGGYSD